MSSELRLLITAGTHAGGSHEPYREYLNPRCRDMFDESRGSDIPSSQEHYGSKKLHNRYLDMPANDHNGQGVMGDVVCCITVPPVFSNSTVTPRPTRSEPWPKFLSQNARRALKLPA